MSSDVALMPLVHHVCAQLILPWFLFLFFQIFLLLDTNNNNVLTWDELLTVEIMPVYEKFPELFERIVSYIVDDEDSSSVISDDPEPIVLEEDNSEGQRSPKDQSSVTKTPDDLEKEKLIELADDGNLVMEEEPFKNPHEELW